MFQSYHNSILIGVIYVVMYQIQYYCCSVLLLINHEYVIYIQTI